MLVFRYVANAIRLCITYYVCIKNGKNTVLMPIAHSIQFQRYIRAQRFSWLLRVLAPLRSTYSTPALTNAGQISSLLA